MLLDNIWKSSPENRLKQAYVWHLDGASYDTENIQTIPLFNISFIT